MQRSSGIILFTSITLAVLQASIVAGRKPYHYWGNEMHRRPAQYRKLAEETTDDSQCFPFALSSVVARGPYMFSNASNDGIGSFLAETGQLVPFACDSVICPAPAVPNCYFDDTVCADDEWCMLDDHIKWGAYAMGPEGETPSTGAGDQCGAYQDAGLDELFNVSCGGETHWGPWIPVRGRCSKFRKQEQSCKGTFEAGKSGPQYTVDENGTVMNRPLLCAPDLICTGDIEPTPHTCVKRRPANTCFQGPWWDSSWCKVGGTPTTPITARSSAPAPAPGSSPSSQVSASSIPKSPSSAPADLKTNYKNGLPLDVLLSIAPAFIMLLPGEIYSPMDDKFWRDPLADKARGIAQNIVETLWPEVYRSETTFPIPIPDGAPCIFALKKDFQFSNGAITVASPCNINTYPRLSGPLYSVAWNDTATEANTITVQANKVWSTIHTLIHNTANPMSKAQILASQGIAVFLRQHFLCDDCRGFWSELLTSIGLPPYSADREVHKHWWWKAHNMATEHTASTRGGHPWIFPSMLDEDFAEEYGTKYNNPALRCQNPWFLPFEVIDEMWNIPGTT